MAKDHKDFVMGFITPTRTLGKSNGPRLSAVTPGVQLQVGGDSMGNNAYADECDL